TYTQLGATMTSFDASGSIGVTDVDSDNSTVTFDGTGPYEGNFGSLVIVNGTWTYTVNDTAVADFTEETVVQDVIEVTASDGVTTTDIVITIGGSQDAIDAFLATNSVISGDFSGQVTERDPGESSTVTGMISVSDPDPTDSPSLVFESVDGTYGTFLLEDGAWYNLNEDRWTYTLNNDSALVQALAEGQKVEDTFTVKATDGKSQRIVITIVGSDDAPVATGDTSAQINLFLDQGFEGDLYEVRGWRRGDDYSITGSGFNGINILTDGTTLQFIDNDSTANRGGIVAPDYYTYEGDDTQRVIIDGKTYSYMIMNTAKFSFSGRVVTAAQIYVDLDGNGRTPYVWSDSNEYAAFLVPVSGSLVKGTSASTVSGSSETPTLTYTQLGATMTSFDASGSIGVTDVDSDNSTVTFDGTGPYEGNFGSLVIVNGTWTYTVNDTAVADFTEDTVVRDVIEVTASDGVTTTDIVITIGGSQAAIDQYLNPQPPESFNLLTVGSGSSETLTFPVSLEWEKSELATGYTVCRQNEDFDNDCEPLGTTDGALELTVGMTGALSALSSEFFIISTNSVGSASSNLLSLSSTDANDLIASIKASDTSQSARFGYSVSISRDGTVFAAGAPNKNIARGAAYVFRFTDGLWQQEKLLTSPNVDANDFYGWAVALSEDGNTLVVGAPQEDGSNVSAYNNDSSAAGAAYVYRFENDAWVFQRYLKADNAGTDDRFGRSVAVSSDGNKVLIGAPGEDSSSTGINSISNNLLSRWAGAAYLFSFNGSTWTQDLYIKASNPGSLDKFGESVTMSGDGNSLAVGAVGESSSTTGINTTPNDASTNAGATYVFENSDGSWAQQAYVKASNTGSGDQFGMSVSLSSDGNTLAVGAMYEDSNTTGINSTPNNSLSDTGAAYVFQRNVDSWSQQAYVKASTVHSGMWFGNSVAMSPNGTSLVVGAWREDSSSVGVNSTPNVSAPQSGAAYLFNFDGSEWSQGAYLKSPMPDWNEYFGNSVDVSDNNNVIVGAPDEGSSSTGFRSGEVYLY
ncbi:VCBS domain-containing protein, partial [Enterovibrio norvegicus]|uniref:VCBS domain-containing protein n=1 Tax=Enterovibrio norvegicus TaxID=188144 RepID=UPI001C705B0A